MGPVQDGYPSRHREGHDDQEVEDAHRPGGPQNGTHRVMVESGVGD